MSGLRIRRLRVVLVVVLGVALFAPVTPLWLSVLPCRESPDPQYSVPGGGRPGSTHYRGRTWKLPVGGRVRAEQGRVDAC